MQVRRATQDDADFIRSIARSSMEASYSLSPQAIDSAIEHWYGAEDIDQMLDDEEMVVLVAETDNGVVGFSESQLVDERGDILWLHVDPDYRGEGIGEALFSQTHDALEERGATFLRGRVLADNAEGNAFYEHEGLQLAGEGKVDIDGTDYIENIYIEPEPTEMEPITGPEEQELYVDYNDFDRGSRGPFHTVYSDSDRSERYSYYCGNCGTLITAMDSMGRMECDECGNVRKPARWDAAYL